MGLLRVLDITFSEVLKQTGIVNENMEIVRGGQNGKIITKMEVRSLCGKIVYTKNDVRLSPIAIDMLKNNLRIFHSDYIVNSYVTDTPNENIKKLIVPTNNGNYEYIINFISYSCAKRRY